MFSVLSFTRVAVSIVMLLAWVGTSMASDVWIVDSRTYVDGSPNIIYTSVGQEIKATFDLTFWSNSPSKMYYQVRTVDSAGKDIQPPQLVTYKIFGTLDVRVTCSLKVPQNPSSSYSFQISTGRITSAGITVERDSDAESFYGEGIGN